MRKFDWVDNPHKEDWRLSNLRTPTASLRTEINPKVIVELPGRNKEHLRIDRNEYSQTVIDRYTELMRERGYDTSLSGPIFIGVEHDGQAYIFEGNHRTRAAIRAGLSSVPVEIRYFGGSEELKEAWYPGELERK